MFDREFLRIVVENIMRNDIWTSLNIHFEYSRSFVLSTINVYGVIAYTSTFSL